MPFSRPIHGGNLVWASAMANCSPQMILDFSASINPLGPPASAIAAIQSSLEDLVSYPDPNYTYLREVFARFHQVPPEWILPGNGAAELLTWACRDLADLQSVCLLTPGFSDYQRALNTFEAKVQQISLPTHSLPPETDMAAIAPLYVDDLALKETLDAEANETVGLLLNNPHNPTGHLFQQDWIVPLLQKFGLVVVDEAFMDFLTPADQQSVIDWVQDYPNLVVIRSLTKFYSLPGLRLGYAIAHPERLQRWQQWRDPWSVNSLADAVGRVVLQDLPFQQRTWDWLAEVQPLLFQELVSLPGLQPFFSAANFLLVQSAQSVTHLQAELLKRHKILLRDCLSFPELGDRYFRIAIRTKEDNQRLLEGLNNVLEAV